MEKKTKIISILAVVIIVIVVGFISYSAIFGFEGKETDFYASQVTGDNISAYKNSSLDLNLSQVSNDPYSVIGKQVKVTGQLYNKEEFEQFNKTRTDMVLKIPELSPSSYILVTYTGTLPFKKGDNITIYGEYFYPAQDKTLSEISNETLPRIHAVYIEKI